MRLLAIDTSTLMASVAIAMAERSPAPTLHVLAWGESDVDTHSDRLLPLIDSVLRESGMKLTDISEIAVGAGPGSFTGLRIGMATAKGLAFAGDKPLRQVSSLAALAMDAAHPPDTGVRSTAAARALLVPVLDARRREVFAGFYRLAAEKPDDPGTSPEAISRPPPRGGCIARRSNTPLEQVAAERVLPPHELGPAVRQLVDALGVPGAFLTGDGVDAYAEELATAGVLASESRRTPSAVSVARLTLLNDNLPDVLLSGAPVYIRPSEAELKFPKGNPGGTFSKPKGNKRGRT